ncbi:TolC family protein [Desulfonatronovibrio magnus]|uniref:TolC family protein n=1 Tax=Desulfonatronovibrio magnus TaxID=698827 RepID=UPI0018DBB6DC|nr:TolC family protein [Desulfonatronovibrio magnus]
MTLTDAVFMALRHNRNLESAYLDRVLARFNLRRDLTEFHPDLEVNLLADTKYTEDELRYRGSAQEDARISSRRSGASVETRVRQRIPTGAEINFIWDNRAERARSSSRMDTMRNEPMDSAWGVDIRQPLLKGGGTEYNRASLEKARIREENAVRSLRDQVINTVTNVITSYRTLLNVYQDLNIQKASLEQAREQMELTRLLISTGRRAANEIVQSEANVARQELALESARASLDDAQLNLLGLLNIGQDITIIPTEQVEFRAVEPDLNDCLRIAFERNSQYLSVLNEKLIAQLDLMQAKNQKLWELSADAGYRQGWHSRRQDPDYRRDEWNVGLSLRVPLPIYGEPKYRHESAELSAQINLRKVDLRISNEMENLENRVINAVRSVESSLKRVKLAQRTVELSEQNYEVSQVQFRMGRISNQDYVRDQDRLRDDRLALNQAIISYENSLTMLDQLLATTLDTWEIDFTPNRADLEQEFLGNRTWMLGD